jgi:hypothetical protein
MFVSFSASLRLGGEKKSSDSVLRQWRGARDLGRDEAKRLTRGFVIPRVQPRQRRYYEETEN